MNRESALIDYNEKIRGCREQTVQLMEQYYLSIEKEFHKQLQKEVNVLCEMIKTPVKYIQISLLRSMMWSGIYEVMLSAHNEEYFLDINSIKVIFDISFIFSPLEELRARLYDMALPFMGKIQKFDADHIIMKTAMSFFKQRANSLRRCFVDFDKWDSVQDVAKCSRLVVKWGEYREHSETIFLMDFEKKTQEQFWEYNKDNEITKWELCYVYQSFDNSAFKNLVVQKKIFLFLGMRNGLIEQVTWESTLLTGAGFRESKLYQVVFAGCDLSLCDFREAKLKEVHFHQCKLEEADFRGATFENTIFDGCTMKNAVFSRQELSHAGLDGRELQDIMIEEEPNVFHV